MPLFIRLTRLTERAHQNIHNLDKMLGEAKQVMEANGARIIQAFTTLGEYDVIAVVEAPDDKTMTKISAMIANQGNFRAETLPAMAIDEFLKSLKG